MAKEYIYRINFWQTSNKKLKLMYLINSFLRIFKTHTQKKNLFLPFFSMHNVGNIINPKSLGAI